MSKTRKHVGIEVRHQPHCRTADGGKCNCTPSHRAEVYSRAEGKRVRKTFPTHSAAKSWRDDHLGAEKRSRLRADPGQTLREAWNGWYEGARHGGNLNRGGEAYKPSALRGYEQAMRLRVLPELGGMRLREISRTDLQKFVTKISGGKTTPSTVKNTLLPVRAVYRQAMDHGEVEANPTIGLKLPADKRPPKNIADKTKALALIEAADQRDRALWATALYGGLRAGELQALRWRDVDFKKAIIRVERSWDPKDGPVKPKSAAGIRTVPMPRALRQRLEEQRERAPTTAPDALVFGRTASTPFVQNTPGERGARLWKKAKLKPLGLHDARHTYASLMIDAGVNAKALSTYMGHANIAITMDTYGHLMPGNEKEAAKRFDAYLENGA